MKIIISPYSRQLRGTTKLNPKNYPHWEELVKLLKEKNVEITQVGVMGEKEIPGVDKVVFNSSLKELKKLILECDTWVSVDNFFQHYCNLIGKSGIVLFGQSDPIIFGHLQNRNLLKDIKYLRPDQFNTWECATFIEEAFVEPRKVLNEILGE